MKFPIVQQHKDLQQAVSARELHDFLEMTERFSSWFDRMLAYGFSESSDFEKCKTFNASNRELEDYFISIDMAKEISMIQRSDKGKQARQYFLECERKLKEQPVMPALPDFTNPADAAIAWAEEYKAKEAAQAEVIELKPKAEALARISNSQGATGIRETAKAVGMKQNEFVAWCVDDTKPMSRRFMYRDDRGVLHAYSHRTSAGLMTQKLQSFIGHDGRDRAEPRVKFTTAGVAKIAEMLEKERSKEAELV